MAASSKFTAARRKAIVEAIARGNTLGHAAALAGVSRKTVYQWLAKGEAATNPRSSYRMFAEDVARANAQVAEEMIGVIREKAPDDWRAAMTFLERRFPDDYAKRERHEVAGPSDGPIKIEVVWPTGSEPPR
jgi:transposase